MTKDDKERYNANALVRGLEILRLFGEERTTLSLVEIAKELNVSRTVPLGCYIHFNHLDI